MIFSWNTHRVCTPWVNYVSKKLSLQDALVKSNEVFETFKQEIEKVYHSFEIPFLWTKFS